VGTSNTAGSAILSVTNNNTTNSTGVVGIRVGLGSNTTCAGSTCQRFMEFYRDVSAGDTGGTRIGRIMKNTAGTGVTFTSGGADFAEYMVLSSASNNGDIVGFG
jgi:hypothetical protein